MSKFKVGDKATVKKDLKIGNTFGGDYYVTSSMTKLAGKQVTISDVTKAYYGDSYDVKGSDYRWRNECFEEPVKSTAKYKPGDEFDISGKVKILGVQINKAGQVMYQTDRHFTIYEMVLDDMKAPTTAPKEPAKPATFGWDAFKSGKIAVHCDTEEKAKAFCAEVKKCYPYECRHWQNGETNWYRYNKNQCYMIDAVLGLQYCYLNWYQTHSFTIIDYPFVQDKPAEQSKPEPIKLYCFKDYVPGKFLTQGKVYEFVDGRIFNYDSAGWFKNQPNYETWCKTNPELAACLVPLIRRPAKVGEWVYIIDAAGHVPDHKPEIGKIYEVIKTDSTVVPTKISNGAWIFECEYLVLDGYVEPSEPPKQPEKPANLVDRAANVGEKIYIKPSTGKGTVEIYRNETLIVKDVDRDGYVHCEGYKEPGYSFPVRRSEYLVVEPEKPVYYSSTTVCIKLKQGFTVGKMYKFKDGITVDDDGDKRPANGKEPIKSLNDDWANGYFIEFKG